MSKSKQIILTSSGGSGHKSAARLIQQESGKKAQNYVTVDVVTGDSEWVEFDSDRITVSQYQKAEYGWLALFGMDFGPDGIEKWNAAQKKSDLRQLKSLLDKRALTEFTVGPNFYRLTKDLLMRNPDANEVVTTQALSINQIFQAINDVNKNHKRNVKFRIVLTDLPTKKAEHFFLTMRKIDLCKYPGVDVVIDSPYPIIDSNLTGAEKNKAAIAAFSELAPNLFHDDGTLFEHVSINFGPGPITQEFKDIYYEKLNPENCHNVSPIVLDLKFSTKQEHDAVSGLLRHGWVSNCKIFKDSLFVKRKIIIPEDAHVTSIMYGSQASHYGTLRTIADEVELYKQNNEIDLQPHYYFVFCGKDVKSENGEASLYQQVLDIAEKRNTDLFKIIPLTYQDHDMISRLYSRADTLAIRGGGLSIMEVEAVAKNEADIVVFSDVSESCSQEKSLTLINPVYWEEGNAEHLQNQFPTAACANKFTYRYHRDNHAKIKALHRYLTQMKALSGDYLKRHLSEFDLSLVVDGCSTRYDLEKIFPDQAQQIRFLVLYKLLHDWKGSKETIELVQGVRSEIFQQAFNILPFPDGRGFSEICESACDDLQQWNPDLVARYNKITKSKLPAQKNNRAGWFFILSVIAVFLTAVLSVALASVLFGVTSPMLLAVSAVIAQITGLSLVQNLMLFVGLSLSMSVVSIGENKNQCSSEQSVAVEKSAASPSVTLAEPQKAGSPEAENVWDKKKSNINPFIFSRQRMFTSHFTQELPSGPKQNMAAKNSPSHFRA